MEEELEDEKEMNKRKGANLEEPIRRRISKRFEAQLEKLREKLAVGDSKVTTVGKLRFVKDDGEYRIATGSYGTEVFLGLKDGDTEVAVKRMPQLYYHELEKGTDFQRLLDLDDPSIVTYVYLDKDEHFAYLALQLYEYTLEEYITELPERWTKKLAKQFLNSLRILHCQNPPILHRDIKPQNVTIDIHGRARLANFGISHQLPEGKTTHHLSSLGATCWTAKETLDDDGDVRYIESTDIQVAGMLIYYILSGGHHPFGNGFRCASNIYYGKYNLDHVDDMVAKDLIEWMIHGEPKERPTVEQCLAHPFFWPNTRREEYLRKIGNEKEVEMCRKDENKVLIAALDRYAEQGQFNLWKQKFREAEEKTRELFEEMDVHNMEQGPDGKKKTFYSDNSFGLLRFIRNLHAHPDSEAAAGINLMEMFPDLFGYVYKFAKEQDWNSRPALKEMFEFCPRGPNEKKRKRNQEELRDDTSTRPRKWLSCSKRWSKRLEKLVIMDDSKVKKVKSLVFGEGEEFRIGEGSNGVEVFLGLRDDGTEVAVKRMSKTHKLYDDLKNDELYLRLPELDDPSIVRYVDFVEDEDYGYLTHPLQLCEYTLEEYITKFPNLRRNQLAKKVLNSLRILHCQERKILHRDINPQNVLIDIQGKARLADFGISRRIDQGKTTHTTSARGTQHWMAKETLDPDFDRYKRSTDIQPAGMLIYYILSGGHHPFGDDRQCEFNIRGDKYNLDDIDDMVAKDLVEWMIDGEPEKRPTVEQCLAHPFFWPNTRREEYLRKIGNEKEAEKYGKAEVNENKAKVLINALEQYAEQGQFNAWKQKFREAEEETRELFEDMDEFMIRKKGPDGKKKKFYSDNSFGLLRFIRNLHAHYVEDAYAAGINLMEMFPALFGYVYKFAREQDWNSTRPALKEMFDFCPRGPNEKKRKRNQEELRDYPDASTSTIPQNWLPLSKRWRPQLEELVNMDDSEVEKVKRLVLGKGKEFRIGEGSNGVEVFLGLRDDGTEVAVKRMSKTHNLYDELKNDELYLRLQGLDDPSIVRYVDFVEDEDYGYLALQLCEYSLEEYITKLPEQGRKQLAEQFLNSLRILHCQDSQILHRDIKPQNVLIDNQGKARLAGFGISRRIDQGKTTYHTSAAGTPCWMAKETLNPGFDRYKISTDIQVAGMLIHYILSGGHHPFLEDTTNGRMFECQNNISKGIYFLKPVVDDDVVAKDLVEWMIHGEPEKRPTVEQCLAHPFFWSNTRREEYLRKIGNEKEVEMHRKAEEDDYKAKDEEEKNLIRSLKVLIPALEQYAEQGQFNAWKQKFREAEEETRKLFEVMDEHNVKKGPDGKKTTFYSDNSFGLLRFIRNLHAHPDVEDAYAAGINLMEMFPALFGYVYKFAREQDWNSTRPALKEMFDFCPRGSKEKKRKINQEELRDDPDASTSTIPHITLAHPFFHPVVTVPSAGSIESSEKKIQEEMKADPNKSITDTLEKRIFKALGEMKNTDFEKFKQHLQQTDNLEGLPQIPEEELGKAYWIDTVDLIMHYYHYKSEQVIVNVLQKIYKYDADTLERLLDILKGPNEKKEKRNQEELRDDPDASTSTIPHDPDASTSTIPHHPDASTSTITRNWLPVSKRWRPQLEKLVIMDDSKVKKVKSLVLGKGKEFRIGEGSNGVEVFLGLRVDGTEVAVKRMPKTHNLYNVLKNDQLYLHLPEFDDPSIVRYVDFVEDKDYGYLALQLCEYTLDEYITKLPEQERKQLAKQVLNSLGILHCQDSKILHRDIKPQNVLIDIQGNARLADFGISRRIEKGKTTYHTKVEGTPCWMAKETLDKRDAAYKGSTDIQVAGMLIHYILSGGHHPFQQDPTKGELECQYNISKGIYYLKHIDDDMVAKDLVQWMIHSEPEERPTVEQCLAHPFFWPNTRREEYLKRIGNEKEVEAEEDENYARDEEEKKLIRSLKVLIPALDRYAEQGQFNAWKQKFREAKEKTRQLFEKMDENNMKKKFYSDNSFGLLRFIHNLHAHYAEAAAGINLMEMFPDLFGYVYKFAREQGWNSRPALKEICDFCPRGAFDIESRVPFYQCKNQSHVPFYQCKNQD